LAEVIFSSHIIALNPIFKISGTVYLIIAFLVGVKARDKEKRGELGILSLEFERQSMMSMGKL
jgi:hypothetical protein